MKKMSLLLILAAAAMLILAGCDPEAKVIPVTGISLNFDSRELVAGETFQLIATVEPADATEKDVVFSSNNRAVATVDAAGLITAVSPGEATITVSAVSGGA